ncbi:hypothetical protein FKV68_24125 (plasmid) [Sinorhizobium mexicanum]|uniref:Uncharacterized protein n=1 Tax=Sinorhizobium mexicanum TaxID=375549 RepID=A0A859QMM3_9HYPH|nr:hypothetical protein FKV68_24125 [Sinorhizobium mexicanum]
MSAQPVADGDSQIHDPHRIELLPQPPGRGLCDGGSITSLEELIEKLEVTRRRGWALCDEEAETRAIAITTPITLEPTRRSAPTDW